jgi:F0F1-type ATP synthase membrane subunit c/vacuolar-type H+-ATPase subunit K
VQLAVAAGGVPCASAAGIGIASAPNKITVRQAEALLLKLLSKVFMVIKLLSSMAIFNIVVAVAVADYWQ